MVHPGVKASGRLVDMVDMVGEDEEEGKRPLVTG